MAISLPKKVKEKIKKIVYKKADEFHYLECGRKESGTFLDNLVNDPEVGQILKEYMPKEKIRTYIKDGLLNAYAKKHTKKTLAAFSPESTIQKIYGTHASIIHSGKGKQSDIFVLRAENGTIYVVSGGTVLKWETALRKALDIIANEPNLTINHIPPSICLQLSMTGIALTEADKKHIITALKAVGVKAIFCGV